MDSHRKNHPAAKDAMDRWSELKTLRGGHESDWEDIARLIRPQRGGFAQQTVMPLQMGGGIGLTDAEKQKKIEEVKDAFHYTIMTVQGRTGLTSQETLIIEEAKMRNWAPHSDRIMEEYAAKKVERRFRMLWRAGQIPPPPKEAEGLPMGMRYQSAASMAMKAREGMAIVQFLDNLGPLAQTDRRYLQRLDPDAVIEALHEASPSLPARMLRSREEADAIAEADAQAQQQAMMLQNAGPVAGAVKDLASAGQAMQAGGMVQ
ncbi:portal protein [Paracoccus sp. SSK6]|uniref:portal protein n=1 Tax=Paracoccus sp. SSK6 TaxID=3143131 RepID=UPI00321AA3BA